MRASVGDAAAEIAAGRLPAVDGAISRLVLHHAPDPAAFLADQLSVLRPGAVLVLADHLADADPASGRLAPAAGGHARPDPHRPTSRAAAWST